MCRMYERQTTIAAQDNVSMWIKTNGIAQYAWAGIIGGFAMWMLRYLLRNIWFSGRHYCWCANPEHNVTIRKSTQQQEVTIHQTGINSNTSTMIPNQTMFNGCRCWHSTGNQTEQTKENFGTKCNYTDFDLQYRYIRIIVTLQHASSRSLHELAFLSSLEASC